MINQSPVFYPRLHKPAQTASLRDMELNWEKAQSAYKNKNYSSAIITLIDYCNPGLSDKYGNHSKTQFKIPHGSSVILVNILEKTLELDAPFVRLNTENLSPALRKAAQINFDELELARLCLERDELHFRASLPLESCEPYVLYEIFRNICLNADYWDDEFTDRYAALPISSPVIEIPEPESTKKAWEWFQSILTDGIQRADEYKLNRLEGYTWDMVIITLQKIQFTLNLKGTTGNKINSEILKLTNGHLPFNDRILSGKTLMNSLKELNFEAFSTEFFNSQIFVSNKNAARLENLQRYFKKPFELSASEYANGQFEACTLTIIQNYVDMLHYNNLPTEIEHFVTDSLLASSEKPWRNAAELLFQSLKLFMDENLLANLAAGPEEVKQSHLVPEVVEQLFNKQSAVNKILSTFGGFFKN